MPLRTGTPLPSLEGAAAWINGEPETGGERKPLLVHFWSLSCSICHDVAAEVARWHATYGPRGLDVVAVHQPRGPQELDAAKVAEDARGAMGITWPCAVDSDHAIVRRFENQFVPAYYLFDREGKLVHRQAGDRGFERLLTKIDAVLEDEVAA